MSDDTFDLIWGERNRGDPESHDRLFDALSSHRRRVVLRHLGDVGVASVEELAGVVATHAGEDRSEAALSLRHGDLPRLRDATLIEYDPRSETARYDGDPLVEDLLSRTRAGDRRG